MRRRLWTLAGDAKGSTAVEFALVLPAFMVLTVGSLGAAALAFSVANLHFTVQDAARCAAVKTTVCADSASTAAYARARYVGLPINPDFASSTTGCGHSVTGTGRLALNFVPQLASVPLTATACYP